MLLALVPANIQYGCFCSLLLTLLRLMLLLVASRDRYSCQTSAFLKRQDEAGARGVESYHAATFEFWSSIDDRGDMFRYCSFYTPCCLLSVGNIIPYSLTHDRIPVALYWRISD